MSIEPLSHSGFFVLRTPLLAFDELERFGEDLEALAAVHDDERLAAALERDRARVHERLRALVDRPEVRDALWVASPDLEASLDGWERAAGGAAGERVALAVMRYVARMAARATPFGLFAGCSVGRIGERTRLVLEPRERSRRRTRLDQDYLDALLAALESEPRLRRELTLRPNSSLYRVAGQLRYVEKRLLGRRRVHHLAAVAESEHLTAALTRARTGATSDELADALVATGVERRHAADYVDDLVDSQVLCPDLAIPVTGREPLDALAGELSAYTASERVGRRLRDVRGALAELDAGGLGAHPDRYRAIAASLAELPAPVEPGRLFQVDLHKPSPAATLGPEVMAELLRGVDLLRRISPPRGHREMEAFRERFARRFEGREVPLLEALDDDAGVGFPDTEQVGASPLLDGLAPARADDAHVDWGTRERHLLHMLAGAIERGDRAIALEPRDVDALSVEERPPLPDALAVSAVLAAASPAAVDGGEFRLAVQGVVGPSGVRLLGRFAHGDPELRSGIERHLRAEEALRGDAVFAELVHLPEGRIGNITGRPVLRDYEIPYLGRSGAPVERQIAADDLMVSVSGGAGGSILLRSRRLGREVLPRLSSAHNFTGPTLPLYRFLCLLQAEVRSGVGGTWAWSWGPLMAAPFLPRLEVGRLVLARARWRLDAGELAELRLPDVAERYRAAQRLRARRGLPRMVALADADNLLPIDLDNVLSVDALARIVGQREEARLVELWPPPAELCARGPEGRYVHELVVPLVRSTPVRSRGNGRVAAVAPAGAARVLPPGSEWLYATVHAGGAVIDRVLTDVVRPLVQDLIGSGAADRWFFVRFRDPHQHLRLRFHGEPGTLSVEVRPRVESALAALVHDGLAWRFSFDTYEREVERYGGPSAIEIAERIFHADSDAVLDLLAMFEPGDQGAEERWRMALCGTSMLLADAGLDDPAKLALLDALRASFGREQGVDGDYARRLGARLREQRRSLEPLLEPGDDAPPDLLPGVQALRRRSERIRPLFDELGGLEDAGRLTVSRAGLASSFVHMYVNRLVRASARQHELVIYDFLHRLHRSRAARATRATAS